MKAAIGLGSNIDDKVEHIRLALKETGCLEKTRLIATSKLYRTAPMHVIDQDWFVNAVVLMETELDPHMLMTELLAIEHRLGRVREKKWGPRIIDLDMLFYEDIVIRENELTIPHPLMDRRRFVLVPLADVAPTWVHPILGRTPREMASMLETDQEVEPL
jgi:2-amino-4-hydroxy-6-hydroxymethyldihydropteridine diphosphokinase